MSTQTVSYALLRLSLWTKTGIILLILCNFFFLSIQCLLKLLRILTLTTYLWHKTGIILFIWDIDQLKPLSATVVLY